MNAAQFTLLVALDRKKKKKRKLVNVHFTAMLDIFMIRRIEIASRVEDYCM